MIRTRFAPSPTGYMHIGNLRTALYEYLIAKKQNGTFILRIEDTDTERLVDGAERLIIDTLNTAGIVVDEGPHTGGNFGPYVQSERKDIYKKYAQKLIDENKAYYCFCTKERLSGLKADNGKYDRYCANISKEETENNLKSGVPYVVRQKMPLEGKTTFFDMIYGEITVDNKELDDQVIIKSDGLPTYNFANVVDDHLMEITHVVRGSEYLSSTPKYNLLYEAFNWDIPNYVHCPPVMKDQKNKLSKRNGDPSFEDLLSLGLLPEAVLNYIALLGWAPPVNEEFFTLDEMVKLFDIKNLSKSPSIFDMQKLRWMNGEYIKKMDFDSFWNKTGDIFDSAIKAAHIDKKRVAELVKTRIETFNDITEMVGFIDTLPQYSADLYVHKKMKTDKQNSSTNLKRCAEFLQNVSDWTESNLHDSLINLVKTLEIKNGQMLWPVRTALSGKQSSFGGAIELLYILGKEESINRINKGMSILNE